MSFIKEHFVRLAAIVMSIALMIYSVISIEEPYWTCLILFQAGFFIFDSVRIIVKQIQMEQIWEQNYKNRANIVNCPMDLKLHLQLMPEMHSTISEKK